MEIILMLIFMGYIMDQLDEERKKRLIKRVKWEREHPNYMDVLVG